MNVVDAAMNFGNAVNLVAVLFLMRTVIKDKNALKGFSVSGTFLTFIAIIGFEVGFFLMENYVSFALGLITLVFWFMVFVFSLRTLLYERKKPPVN
jgi:hypothetical protein